MIYFHWLAILIYVIVVVGVMLAVLMDDRPPAKTMAWMLVLTFLPVVGIILYFFFGQNTRKERFISQRSLDQITRRSMLEFVEQKNLQLPDEHSQLISMLAYQGQSLPFQGNSTDIYTDGRGFFTALLREIGRARHHIHLTTYIFDDDPLGHLLADALADKAAQGVEVRIIYDDVGCWRVGKVFFERMREAGIEVHAFMPVKFPAFTSKVNYRNHRKLCIVDGSVGFIGGMNIAMRYLKGQHGKPWRDTHLRITGTAVSSLQRAFFIDWYFVDRTLISNQKYYAKAVKEGDALMQVVTSQPISPWPEIEQAYVRVLLQARQYVYMETPYFLPTEPILFAMRTAALAGVDVRLMLPLHSDARLVEWASRSYVMQTVAAGIKVFFYQPGFNHSKLLVSDDTLATVGSANIDFRSFENNFEANVFIYDRATAMRLKEVFLNDQSDCVPLSKLTNLQHRPFVNRLWESLVRLLSPLL